MADAKKTAAKAAAPTVDTDHTYKVQLKRYVPDWRGQALLMTQVYHVSGDVVKEWVSMDIVGAYEVDNTVHPDAQAPNTLDEPKTEFIDARHEHRDEPMMVPPLGQAK